MRRIIKSIIFAMAFSASSIVCCVGASAATETTAVTTAPETSTTVTTTTSVTSPTATTTTVDNLLTSEEIEVTAVSIDFPEETTTELENPYTDGMLADDALYSYILDYLNDGVSLDTEGSGVLIDETLLNFSHDDEENGEEETGSNGIATDNSAEKVMYTVVTRDGSTFYIIVDKSMDGENVYFLNSVDLVDLASLINENADDSEDLSAAEKAIISEAGEVVKQDGGAVGDENDSKTDVQAQLDEIPEGKVSNDSSSSNMIYIIFGVLAVGFLGFMAYKKIGPGKKNNVSFNEDDDEEYEEEAVEDIDNEETAENLEDRYDE